MENSQIITNVSPQIPQKCDPKLYFLNNLTFPLIVFHKTENTFPKRNIINVETNGLKNHYILGSHFV